MTEHENPSPWLSIDLDAYEGHMSHPDVAQLTALHAVMRAQMTDHPSRRIGILGIASGNGLDLIDSAAVEAVYGYELNADYLAACSTRHGARLGDRLHLIHATVDRSSRIQPVDLLIANLFVEYIGVPEFVALLDANAGRIGMLSCVTQHDQQTQFVSPSPYASALTGLASSSANVDATDLTAALNDAQFSLISRTDQPLPSGKTLIRQDFAPMKSRVSPRGETPARFSLTR